MDASSRRCQYKHQEGQCHNAYPKTDISIYNRVEGVAPPDRQFSFSVVVRGDHARLLRWDPSAVVVTTAFNYRTNPRWMAEFLWRSDHFSVRGNRHKTVRSSAVVLAACPWFGSQPSATATPITTSHDHPESGPWSEERLLYMKDTWRFISDVPNVEVMPGHEIYKILRHRRTPNIPERVTGGDTEGDRTQTQELVNAPWLVSAVQVQMYETSYHAIFDALAAVDCAKILHRDTSAGNIILTDEGRDY
ncbi:hypothetical protein L210DRAFT_981323 [Boletus edulis BED1]|uniref:Uncharacterized protein n=1 Tax=Boletus edulis BED1 TaxID=1328754 RepID=A0AAD4C2V2_BOLED|nr:hypothetical protein L210DRAFT_981323 [Boletus edulis BED1]